MKAAEIGAENGGIGLSSTTVEQYLPAIEIAQLLELSNNELTRLPRSAVLVRKRDPYDSRAFIYPAWENVRRYILHGRARKEGAHTTDKRKNLYPEPWTKAVGAVSVGPLTLSRLEK
jgi:hypothetical protein